MNCTPSFAEMEMIDSAMMLLGVCGIFVGWMARAALFWSVDRIEHAIERAEAAREGECP